MGIKKRAAAMQSAYSDLKALGRDPASLQFDRMDSPTEGIFGNRPIMLFGTNNYLGLTFDEACIEAAAQAARDFGVGTTGSRIANGTYDPHRMLEAEIAQFYDKRAAILYSTGFLANLGVISGLAEKGDHLLIDADSHASIYDAAKMSDADTIRFRHNNPEDLAKRLRRLKDVPGDKLVVIEGIYSMLGDSAPLAEFAAVKREAGPDVYLLVDEAHSLGVMGATGRGKCQLDDVEADCDYIVGTFSKSAATTGGYCVSDIPEFEALRSFSAALHVHRLADPAHGRHRARRLPPHGRGAGTARAALEELPPALRRHGEDGLQAGSRGQPGRSPAIARPADGGHAVEHADRRGRLHQYCHPSCNPECAVTPARVGLGRPHGCPDNTGAGGLCRCGSEAGGSGPGPHRSVRPGYGRSAELIRDARL